MARMRKLALGLVAAAMIAPTVGQASAAPTDKPQRSVEPVVLTGRDLPGWSGPAAEGVAKPYPNGANDDFPIDQLRGSRDAHAGTLIVPPRESWGNVDPEKVAAYRYEGGQWTEIPVQVDERFPYFLANPHSGFGFYSGTDKELTYEWDVESWKRIAGECNAEYPAGESAMEDPVETLDDDDEVVFMASDAGEKAPAENPEGITGQRQEVTLVDPTDPTGTSFVYLFTKEGGSAFTADNGYVHYERDANADQWIDRSFFADDDPEKLGTSNRGYGPNLSGTVCKYSTDPVTGEQIVTVEQSTDRFPRDGVTVTTDTYRWRATGRWMVREINITKPKKAGHYGPDLIDRWKGRAFQQSPDSTISLVGFEDEQVNWEANSALLGELEGPVRAIREVWGADSGTNVTKTETFYRDVITYRYRVRVHPIPPDGLYTSWDYNHDAVATYYNETKTEGVAIDGLNDDTGQIDEAPTGQPAFFDAPDPTFTKPLAFFNWEQVAGAKDNGSLVYMLEMKNASSLINPAVTPYYRDDACLDDGTGDNPSPRAWPGESYEWIRSNTTSNYPDLPCYTEAPKSYKGPYRQGCFGCHGIHFFVTGDSDNAWAPVPVTEIDGQQWQWLVPTKKPENIGDAYANTVKVPLIARATPQG